MQINRVTRDPKKRARGERLEAYNGFLIKHYAGAVTYNAEEFLVKNADTAHPDTKQLLSQSKVSKLFFLVSLEIFELRSFFIPKF